MIRSAPENGPAAMKVVILAGGFGTRLAEHTDAMPKPMVEIGGRPMLWHILKIYSHFGYDDFLIACGYRGDVIKRFFLEYRERMSDLCIDYRLDHVETLSDPVEPWRVSLIDTGTETMTGGRLRRLAGHLTGGTFMMTYGDGVVDLDVRRLVDFHRAHGRLATFTAVRPPSPFGHAVLDGDRVVSFTEKPADGDEWISGGFFVLEPAVLDLIAGDETSFETETLARLAEADQLRAFRHDGFWHPMDTLRDVRTLNELSGQTAPWQAWE